MPTQRKTKEEVCFEPLQKMDQMIGMANLVIAKYTTIRDSVIQERNMYLAELYRRFGMKEPVPMKLINSEKPTPP